MRYENFFNLICSCKVFIFYGSVIFFLSLYNVKEKNIVFVSIYFVLDY